MTQYQQIYETLKKLGGKASFDDICNNVDYSLWKTSTPKNSISRCLTTGNNFYKENELWILIPNQGCNPDEIYLHCSDGVLVTAIAKKLDEGWKIFGISQIFGFGNAEFKKDLFNTYFDEISPYNSMSGVSFVAVKKSGLWGLIRFRLNPEYAVWKEGYRKALGSEPIDEKLMDPIGREIKFIEKIRYLDINILIKNYKLGAIDEIVEWHEWSDELKKYTKDAFSNLDFGFTSEGTVRMKRSDGAFGFIPVADTLKYDYNVHYDKLKSIEHYDNVSDMIEAGWVLD